MPTQNNIAEEREGSTGYYMGYVCIYHSGMWLVPGTHLVIDRENYNQVSTNPLLVENITYHFQWPTRGGNRNNFNELEDVEGLVSYQDIMKLKYA